MGHSTDGILAYGYDLGGTDAGWKIAEAEEVYGWLPAWAGIAESDLAATADRLLLASVGFTEAYAQHLGYFVRQEEARAQMGVELIAYCSIEYPQYLLAAHWIRCARGDHRILNFPALERIAAEQGWAGKLQSALDTLGITPIQTESAWILASFEG